MSASLSKSPPQDSQHYSVARSVTPKFPPYPSHSYTLSGKQASLSPPEALSASPESVTGGAEDREGTTHTALSNRRGPSRKTKTSTRLKSVSQRSKAFETSGRTKSFRRAEPKKAAGEKSVNTHETEATVAPGSVTSLDQLKSADESVDPSGQEAAKVYPRSPPESTADRRASFAKTTLSSLEQRHKPPPIARKTGRLFTLMAKEGQHRSLLGKPQLQLPDEQNAQENENVYTPIEGAQRVEDVGGAAMLAADNFPTLVAHFKLSAAFARFTPSRIDRNRAIPFDAVSLKRSPTTNVMEAVWRRVAVEADSSNGNFRLFDVDKKVFLGSRLNLDKAPSLKPDGIRHFKGLHLGKGRPTIDQWEHFISFWLENRQIPITILAKNNQDIQDLGRILAFLQAYKLRCREEAEWAQRAHELIVAEMTELPQSPAIEVRTGDDFDDPKVD